MSSKKDQIVKAIEDMNISMLEVLLDDNKTYQETSKEMFLKKLDTAFRSLQNEAGDTKLIAHNGVCNHDLCSNRGCKGFSFVGDKSKSHLDLIFEENESDDCKDICHCNGFLTDEITSQNDLIVIDVTDDEKIGFKPKSDFLLLSVSAKNAVEELQKYNPIEREDYSRWLENYEDLFEEYLYNQQDYSESYLQEMGFIDFEYIYRALSFLKTLDTTNQLALFVVFQFDAFIYMEVDSGFKEWVMKEHPDAPWGIYADLEDLFETEVMRELFADVKTKLDKDLNTRTVIYYKGLEIDVSDFENIVEFKRLREKHYADALEKFPQLKNLL